MVRKFKFSFVHVLILFSIALLIGGVVYVVQFLNTSYEIRQFSNQLWVLNNESTICIAEYNGKTVRVSTSNIHALCSLPEQTKRVMKMGNPKAQEEITYYFTCNKEETILKVELIDDETVRISIDGERDYCFYFTEEDRYPLYQQIASPEGYKEANKLLKEESSQ